MSELPRKWVTMDTRGRVTLPRYLLEALGVDMEEAGNAVLLVEAYPSLGETKALMLKKGRI